MKNPTLLLVLILCASAMGADKPPEPLADALAALRKEYREVVKTGESQRTGSNFFNTPDTRFAEILPDEVLLTLEKPIKGADPRETAWVKWQLLSALPEKGKLDEKQVKQLISAYGKAPRPLPHPSIDNKERNKLDRMLTNKKQDDQLKLRGELAEINKQLDATNAPLLSYRDALFDRLPASAASFEAGFKDAHGRMSAGLSPESIMVKIDEGIRSWTYDGKPAAGQIKSVGSLVSKLMLEKGPEIYTDVVWNADKKNLEWQKTPLTLNSKNVLAELQKHLEDRPKSGK